MPVRTILALAISSVLFSMSAFGEPSVVQPWQECKAKPRLDKFQLNLVNVDLSKLVVALASSFCKSAVVVDFPTGKVTYTAPADALNADQARPLLVKLFEDRGFAIDEEAAQIRIRRAPKPGASGG